MAAQRGTPCAVSSGKLHEASKQRSPLLEAWFVNAREAGPIVSRLKCRNLTARVQTRPYAMRSGVAEMAEVGWRDIARALSASRFTSAGVRRGPARVPQTQMRSVEVLQGYPGGIWGAYGGACGDQ